MTNNTPITGSVLVIPQWLRDWVNAGTIRIIDVKKHLTDNKPSVKTSSKK
jgi:hypothetical protein